MDKPEFPALLPVGFHNRSAAEVREMCVSDFPLSRTREPIMIGLETLFGELTRQAIATQVWVDGSFLTAKVNPEDVDIVLCTKAGVYDNGTDAQRNVLNNVASMDLKQNLHCDSYVFYEYPEDHPLHAVGEFTRAYWMRQFGMSRSNEFKGIAVVDCA